MTLATRISLAVAAVLAVAGALAGVALHRAVADGLRAELAARVESRLAWLRGALDVEPDDGEVQLDARAVPSTAAEEWLVATPDGKVLWSSAGSPGSAAAAAPAAAEPAADGAARGPRVERSERLTFGDPDAPAAVATQVRLSAGPASAPSATAAGGRAPAAWQPLAVERVPPTVLAAAAAAVPRFVPDEALVRSRRKKRDAAPEVTYELRGGRQAGAATRPAGTGAASPSTTRVRIAADGTVLRVRADYDDTSPHADYRVEGSPGRIDLVITARTSAEAAERQLAALATRLAVAVPVAVIVTSLLLAWLVRRQLRPLAEMARAAAAIGPETLGTDGRNAAAAAAAATTTPTDGQDVPRAPELRSLRNALDGMLGRLAEGLRHERRFASTAAHELRTPLAQMRVALDVTLSRPRTVEEYERTLAGLSEDVRRLEGLVASLLHLARAGAPVAAPTSIHLRGLLASAAKAGDAPADLAGVPDDLWVRGDVQLLQTAFANVLRNAHVHAPGPPPTVSAHRGDGRVEVVIADRGPGVPEVDRERIFEPLARLDDGASSSPAAAAARPGFGLGLAVARAAVRSLGGRLRCQARPDGLSGAAFSFDLPLGDAPEAR